MAKQYVVAMTGASGSMGAEALRELAECAIIDKIKILLLKNKKEKALGRKLVRKYSNKILPVYGDIGDENVCKNLVCGADYVVNIAAVIPPIADHMPDLADRCNRIGAINIANAVNEIKENQPKLVHISTVALYGHRNHLHPWGRVGDPLLPSVYDNYAASKLKGERYVLDSDVAHWVVLRQTGMLHKNMLKNNMKDGLMFHTTFNVPLEWVTAHDSGVLVRRIVECDNGGTLCGFWNKVYNIGGGAENRYTGYDTFNQGFKMIGGSTEQFLKPGWNSIRNFHGLWFADGDVLNDYLGYRSQNVNDYWKEVLKCHPAYNLAKILPRRLIGKLVIEPLLKDDNSPRRWVASNQIGRIKAFFGSRENLKEMPTSWKDYPVLAKGELADDSIDYDELRNEGNAGKYLLSHGYDETKADKDLDLEDMCEAAKFRGGKCLSTNMTKGDLYTKLLWECDSGHRFMARPYTVLKAGHWCQDCCEPSPWQFDILAKKIPFYEVWYDTHARGENSIYYFDGTQAKCDNATINENSEKNDSNNSDGTQAKCDNATINENSEKNDSNNSDGTQA